MTQNDKTPPMQTLSSHEISTDRFSIGFFVISGEMP